MIRKIIKAVLIRFGLLDEARWLRDGANLICDYLTGCTYRLFPYNFGNAKREWVRVPIGDIGYISTEKLLSKSEQELINLARACERTRYDVNKWRNYKNLWRKYSGVDEITGKTILDFGCGFGIESLQFAKRQNRVYIADINQSTVDLAEKVLKAHGFQIEGKLLISNDYPFIEIENKIDIFYSNGVLHHTPKFKEILKRATEILGEDGQIRLMLYSDVSWKIATNADLPAVKEDIRINKHFKKFVRHMDAVGNYADWYNKEKIEYLIGDFLKIESLNYITRNNSYLMVTFKIKK